MSVLLFLVKHISVITNDDNQDLDIAKGMLNCCVGKRDTKDAGNVTLANVVNFCAVVSWLFLFTVIVYDRCGFSYSQIMSRNTRK